MRQPSLVGRCGHSASTGFNWLPVAIIYTDTCMPLSFRAAFHNAFGMSASGSFAAPDVAMPHREALTWRADRMNPNRERPGHKDSR